MRLFGMRLVLILAFFPVLTPFSLVSESALFAAVGSDKADARPIWEEGIAYLFSMLKNKDSSFDVQKVSGLLDFVVSEKGGVTNLDPGKRENATGAYFIPMSRRLCPRSSSMHTIPRSRPTLPFPRSSVLAAGRSSRTGRLPIYGKRSAM